MRDDNTLLAVDLTNPDYYDVAGTQIVLEKDLVHIARTVFLWQGTAYQRLAVRNHGDRPLALQIAVHFDSDFADLFEVRGLPRPRRGTVSRNVIGPDQALLSYLGLDKVTRHTLLTFDPAPNEITTTKASYRLLLAPGQSKPIFLAVTCNGERTHRPVPFLRGLLAAHRELRGGTRNITTVETSNELFNEILCRSAADLAMLVTETPQGAYPYAGIPWYSTTFGRDGIITALQMLWCDPGMARGVLRRLAALQAKTTDAASDAEPGKILHEMRAARWPCSARCRSVSITAVSIRRRCSCCLPAYTSSGPATSKRCANCGPRSKRRSPGSTGPAIATRTVSSNTSARPTRGWPIRGGRIRMMRSSMPMAAWPLARSRSPKCKVTCSPPSNSPRAALRGWDMSSSRASSRPTPHGSRSVSMRRSGVPRSRPMRSRSTATSSRAAYAPRMQARSCFPGSRGRIALHWLRIGLINPRFFSGWGIRTVARGEARYNPMSYHNGSIWPHDNSLIALGMARYGLKRPVAQITRGLFEAATYMDLRRLPELFCGFQRERRRGPTLYPVACAPQAWASAAVFTLIEALLGLEFRPAAHEIFLRNPRLPPFLDEVILRNLQVGKSRLI